MIKKTKKETISIIKIILITFISIMLISSSIIGTIIFKNWFAYADRGLTEIISGRAHDVFDKVELYMRDNWVDIRDNNDFNNYLEEFVNDSLSIVLVVERNTGETIGNNFNFDNYLRFQDGTNRPITINRIGYPAFIEAYNTYLDTNVRSYKLKNIENTLYINISEYKANELDLLIFTAIPDIELTSTVRDNIIYTMIFAVIATFITIGVYYILIKRLLKPVDNLKETADRFAKGDFSQRASIVRYDEIGSLARAFNNMADIIWEFVNDLEDKVKERTLELEDTNEMLTDNRNHLRLILDSTAEAIYGLDIEGNCTFCNASSLEMLGYSNQDELIGKNMHYQIHHTRKNGKVMPIDECSIIKAIKEGKCYHVDDEVFWRKDGTFFEVEYHAYPQLKDGEIVGAVVTFMDITESKKVQERIDYLSFHDPVTGVYNRVFFENELKRIDNNKNLPISIIYGDVNGLKLLNDMYGHEMGDELLKRTANVLTMVCRDNDIVARIGGDEFVIILSHTAKEDANKVIKRIKTELSNEKIGGLKSSISLAADTKTTPEQDIKDIIKNAETNMYTSKTLESKNVNSGLLKDIMDSLYERSPRERLHSINVSRMCEEIGQSMNLSETEIKSLKDAGFYHDIGKIVLDKKALNKEGKLSEKELEEMKRHPLIGYRLLNLFNETLDIAEVVLTHHERWDGTGYPKGLKGEEMPINARIIAVAEGYDAMTNKIDGQGLSHEEALEEIKLQSGTKYDPIVVDVFLTLYNNKQ